MHLTVIAGFKRKQFAIILELMTDIEHMQQVWRM